MHEEGDPINPEGDERYPLRKVLKSMGGYRNVSEIWTQSGDLFDSKKELVQSLQDDPLIVSRWNLYHYVWPGIDNVIRMLTAMIDSYTDVEGRVKRFVSSNMKMLKPMGISSSDEVVMIMAYIGVECYTTYVQSSVEYALERLRTIAIVPDIDDDAQSHDFGTVTHPSESSDDGLYKTNQVNGTPPTKPTDEVILEQAIVTLRSRSNPMTLNGIITNSGLDVDENHLGKLLRTSPNVIQSSGRYRYHIPSPEEFRKLCDIIRGSLEQDILDVDQEFKRHESEYRGIDIRNQYELASVILRYFPGSSSSVASYFRTSAIKASLSETSTERHGSPRDRATVQKILVSSTETYLSLDQIYDRFVETSDSPLTRPEIKMIVESSDSILCTKYGYRLYLADVDGLKRLLHRAAEAIDSEYADSERVFHWFRAESLAMGLRTSEEMYKAIVVNVPRARSSVVGRLRLAPFREAQNSEPHDAGMGSGPCSEPSVQESDVPRSNDEGTVVESQGTSPKDRGTKGPVYDIVICFMDDGKYHSLSSISASVERVMKDAKDGVSDAISMLASENRIFSYGRTYRLHRPIDRGSFESILSKYHDSVYSVFVLYRDNKLEFESLDILEWGELAKTLQMFGMEGFVEGTDDTLFSFDGCTVESMVKRHSEANPGCDSKELASSLMKVYGIPTSAVLSILDHEHPVSSVDMVRIVPVPESDSGTDGQTDVDRVKAVLGKEFYSRREFMGIVAGVISDFDENMVDDDFLSEIGYSGTKEVVFQNSFRWQYDAFRELISKEDIIDIPMTWMDNNTIRTNLRRMRESFDILQFGEWQYISMKRLEASGITKAELRELPKNVEVEMGDLPFTVRYLRVHKVFKVLDNKALDDSFFDRILVSSYKFKTKNFDDTMAYCSSQAPTLGLFVETIIERDGDMDLYDLEKTLRDEYGLDRGESGIKRAISSSSQLIYMDSIDKVLRK